MGESPGSPVENPDSITPDKLALGVLQTEVSEEYLLGMGGLNADIGVVSAEFKSIVNCM
jgi:hypothetical protein